MFNKNRLKIKRLISILGIIATLIIYLFPCKINAYENRNVLIINSYHKGESPSSISFIHNGSIGEILDYKELSRFNIPLNTIPKNYEIIT